MLAPSNILGKLFGDESDTSNNFDNNFKRIVERENAKQNFSNSNRKYKDAYKIYHLVRARALGKVGAAALFSESRLIQCIIDILIRSHNKIILLDLFMI